MNFFDGALETKTDGRRVFSFAEGEFDFTNAPLPKNDGPCTLGLRPESIKVLAKKGREAEGPVDVKVKVALLEPHGHENHLVGLIESKQVIVRSANPHRLAVMNSSKKGDVLEASVDRSALHWFAADELGERLETVHPTLN